MLNVLFFLCCFQMMATEVILIEKPIQPTTFSKRIYNKAASAAYYGTGLTALYAASLALSNKCYDQDSIMASVVVSAALGSWLLKETFRDAGLTWVDLKNDLNQYKLERDIYADMMDVELTSSEESLGEISQALYLVPKHYWREMISLSGATLLLSHAYKMLNKYSHLVRI